MPITGCFYSILYTMKLLLQVIRPRRSAWLSFVLCISTVALCAVAVSPRAEQGVESHERFIELDSELQGIKEEILAINRDMRALEEMSLYPQGQQIVVLVSIAAGSGLSAARITLNIDGQIVSRHDYSEQESDALLNGGVHRLYSGGVSEGEHRVEVSLSGYRTRKKPFTQRNSTTIHKVPGRKYLELHLGPGERKSEPALTIREWQQ
jgi:hypothetical protein